MKQINLDQLREGQPGISPDIAGFLVEAAVFCLVENGHQSGVVLEVEGHFTEKVKLLWAKEIDEQIRRGWLDIKEATEYGATALAALLLFNFENLVVYERIPQSGDADFYLQSVSNQKIEAMMEVSGIWQQSETNTPQIRINIKKKRLEKSKSKQNLPVFIVVTEFSHPKSKIEKYG